MPLSENVREIVKAMGQRRVSAIIRTSDQSVARDAMRAAVAGGFRMVEFTLTTPGALELVAEFAADPSLLVGAGTVLTPDMAGRAVRAGARFLVSPVFDEAVVTEARRLGVASVPGTYTPTEMYRAHLAGADIIKVFPGPPNLADYVRVVLGPLPELRLFPTSGVTLDNMSDVLAAGAFGVGFVASLFDAETLRRRDWGLIERRAGEIHARLAAPAK